MSGQVKAARYSEPVEVVTTREKPMVRLTMTEEHARVLLTLLYKVGGSPGGLRGYADDVCRAFEGQGVKPVRNHGPSDDIYAGDGRVRFPGGLPEGWPPK